jgi:sugar (pentulose or hexulose) kinase
MGSGPVSEPVVLGLDLGTTEAKAAFVAPDGRAIALGRAPYRSRAGHVRLGEQDPAGWWEAVGTAARELDRRGVEVRAVCGVAQGPTLAVVDERAEPVAPAITWQDPRVRATGFGLVPALRWLAREAPATVREARWLLSAWDALGLWLSGSAATTLQGHESPLDPAALDEMGIGTGRIPPPVPVGTQIGELRPAAAEALGLPAGIPVIGGVNDGTASILGAGLLHPGDAVDTGGTSGGFGIYADRPLDRPGTFSAPAPLPGLWMLGGAMAATGASLDWLRTAVLGDRWLPEDLLGEAAGVPPGAGGLVFLPYLAGERAPIFDEAARGAFVGLTLGHGRAHLVRAVLEGGAFALRHVAEPIVDAGIEVTELRIAGRPSPGDVWARIKADVLGVPVAIPAFGETAVLGAAILAAAGVGLVADRAAGVRAMTAVARRIEPDAAAHDRYDEAYAIYRSLYPVLASSFRELGRVAASR